MKEQFVPHEIAILLKEKGFTDECMASYEISLTAQENEEDGFSGPFGWEKGEVNFNKGYFANGVPYCDFSNEHWLYCAAPLWQQVIDWLRDTHNIDIWVQPFTSERIDGKLYLPDESYSYFIFKDGHFISDKVDFSEPEEARQAVIEHALTLI
jgi:hypothetical protein